MAQRSFPVIGLAVAATRRCAPVVRALLLALGVLAAGSAAAATLHPGDIVLAQAESYPYGTSTAIYRLDPATLDTSLISLGPLVTSAADVAADRLGHILVADRMVGIVDVDGASGTQSLLVDAGRLGGQASGVCVAPEGHLLVSVRGSSPSVLRVTRDGSTIETLSSGDHLTYPGGLAVGPDGGVYVTEGGIPTDNGGVLNGIRGFGSIVRLDPVSGSQAVVAADSLFLGPFEVAFVRPNEVWTLQAGYLAGRRGCFVSTRLSDGTSAMAEATTDCRSRGIAVLPDGTTIVSDCHTIGPDCYTLFTMRLPAGPTILGIGGRMTVVPSDIVPAHHTSWGTIKTLYR